MGGCRKWSSLAMIEEMFILPILSVVSVFRLLNGALITRGFIANFSQDIKDTTEITKRFANYYLKKIIIISSL